MLASPSAAIIAMPPHARATPSTQDRILYVEGSLDCTGDISPMTGKRYVEFNAVWASRQAGTVTIVQVVDGKPTFPKAKVTGGYGSSKLSGYASRLPATFGNPLLRESLTIHIEPVQPTDVYSVTLNNDVGAILTWQWSASQKHACGMPDILGG